MRLVAVRDTLALQAVLLDPSVTQPEAEPEIPEVPLPERSARARQFQLARELGRGTETPSVLSGDPRNASQVTSLEKAESFSRFGTQGPEFSHRHDRGC